MSQPADPNRQIITSYENTCLYDHLDVESRDMSAGAVIDFSSVKEYMFSHGIRISINLPHIKLKNPKHRVEMCWPKNILAHAIKSVTITSPTMGGKYSITGKQIESYIMWYRRNNNTLWEEKLGNDPRLQTFAKELLPYHNTFELPLFFNEDFPLPLTEISNQDVKITIELNKVKDLLRIRYRDAKIWCDLDYGSSVVNDRYDAHINIIGDITCTTKHRVTKNPELEDFMKKMYHHRSLVTFKEKQSDTDVVNRDHEISIDINGYVLGIMWNLEAVYPGQTSNSEANLHTYGDYSLDPMDKNKIDPVAYTQVTIHYDDESITTTYLDTETNHSEVDGCAVPLHKGYHFLSLGVHPLRNLKTKGIKVKSIDLSCHSSDRSDIVKNDINASGITVDVDTDEEDEVEEIKYSRVERSKRIDQEPSRRNTVTESSLRYRLVARFILPSTLTIEEKRMVFKGVA